MSSMLASGRRKTIAFFITLGAALVAATVALNVGWVLLNWREVAMLVVGLVFFAAIIAGLILNTIFLVREIRRNEQHDAFINAVTHELKTPITSMRLYLETLQSREVDADRRREFYTVMLADADRLQHTVDQVLQAGRTGQRWRKLDRTHVDLGKLAQECIAALRARIEAYAGDIIYSEHVDSRPLVMGDADELRTAVTNLIDNAIKYSNQDVAIEVEVATEGEANVSLRVRDSGVGIPERELKRIFKRFYRLPGRRNPTARGTGLGLSIVSAVVRRHGGSILAESPGNGRGSTFTMRLPRARE